jgi:hypothetical protein
VKPSGREVELSRNHATHPEAFVSHPDAALTPRARLRLACPIVEQNWPVAEAAKMFMVSERRAALPSWLHFSNHHRAHSANGGQPPITRLTNLPGQHL